MPTTSLYKCSRCKKEFNFDNIKYDYGHNLICIECLNKNATLPKKKSELNDRIVDKFICFDCRFQFNVRRDSRQVYKCPYCGKKKLMLVKKYKDGDDLIKDSQNPRYDY